MSVIIDGMDQSKASLPHLKKSEQVSSQPMATSHSHYRGDCSCSRQRRICGLPTMATRSKPDHRCAVASPEGVPAPNCQEWRSPSKALSPARQLCARKQNQVCSHISCTPSRTEGVSRNKLQQSILNIH